MVITKDQAKNRANVITLRGAPITLDDEVTSDATNQSQVLRFRLDADTLANLEKSIRESKGSALLQLGKVPTLKWSTASKTLSFRRSKCEHELYTTQPESQKWQFVGQVSHDASLEQLERHATNAEMADQKLKDVMDAYQRDRAMNRLTIVEDMKLSNGKPRHGRTPSGMRLPSSIASQSSPLTIRSPAPTSNPSQTPEQRAKLRAQRHALMHLLAVQPLSEDSIVRRTAMPKDECVKILEKLADKTPKGWELKRKAYQELDCWQFPYPDEDDRSAALANALQAFDRARLDGSDPIRQKLLRKADRGKGHEPSNLNIDVSSLAAGKKRPPGDHRKLLAHAGHSSTAPANPSASPAPSNSAANQQNSTSAKSVASSKATPVTKNKLKPISKESKALGSLKAASTNSPRASPMLKASRKLGTEISKSDSVAAAGISTPRPGPSKVASKVTPSQSKSSSAAKTSVGAENDDAGAGSTRKRKGGPEPKSKEFIEDSDEEVEEADRAERQVKRAKGNGGKVNEKPKSNAGSSGSLAARPKAAAVAKTEPSKQKPEVSAKLPLTSANKLPAAARSLAAASKAASRNLDARSPANPSGASKSSHTSNQSTSSSVSVSSPLTPLGISPQSTVSSVSGRQRPGEGRASSTTSSSTDSLAALERRYEQAFKKHMHAFLESNKGENAKAEYERAAVDLATSMNVVPTALYVPAGVDMFPVNAIRTLSREYDHWRALYDKSIEHVTALGASGSATPELRARATQELRMLKKRCTYVWKLHEAAMESKRMEAEGNG